MVEQAEHTMTVLFDICIVSINNHEWLAYIYAYERVLYGY